MNKIPFRIKKCPIEEAVFEIRFITIFPAEAVFGVFYQIINNHFPEAKLIQLPILQLPEAVRQADPTLQFQAHHRLQNENQSISIGPRVISFSNQKPYLGWENWSSFIISIVDELVNVKVFKNIERTGLRYINYFNNELFTIANLQVILISSSLSTQSTTLRSEIIDDDYIKILQAANNVKIESGSQTYTGSAIDIDILKNLNIDNQIFKQNLSSILNESHDKEKELFFNLLKEEYINSLEPIYKD